MKLVAFCAAVRLFLWYRKTKEARPIPLVLMLGVCDSALVVALECANALLTQCKHTNKAHLVGFAQNWWVVRLYATRIIQANLVD